MGQVEKDSLSQPATPAGPLPHRPAHRDLRVPTHRRPEEQQPDTDEREPRNHGTEHRHAARVGHRIFGDRVGDHALFRVYVASIRIGVIYAGSTVDVAGISAAICALTY